MSDAQQVHDIGRRRAWVIWLVGLGLLVAMCLLVGLQSTPVLDWMVP